MVVHYVIAKGSDRAEVDSTSRTELDGVWTCAMPTPYWFWRVAHEIDLDVLCLRFACTKHTFLFHEAVHPLMTVDNSTDAIPLLHYHTTLNLLPDWNIQQCYFLFVYAVAISSVCLMTILKYNRNCGCSTQLVHFPMQSCQKCLHICPNHATFQLLFVNSPICVGWWCQMMSTLSCIQVHSQKTLWHWWTAHQNYCSI